MEIDDKASIAEAIGGVAKVRDSIRRFFGSALGRVSRLKVSSVSFRIPEAEEAGETE